MAKKKFLARPLTREAYGQINGDQTAFGERATLVTDRASRRELKGLAVRARGQLGSAIAIARKPAAFKANTKSGLMGC
jgi:hypothetical protein